jgi:hypothetical protein
MPSARAANFQTTGEPELNIYIAIGVNAWGKGFTADAALREMRKHVGDAHKRKYILYRVSDPEATVTFLGAIYAKSEPVEVARVGIPKSEVPVE